jgi:hypothetical protein
MLPAPLDAQQLSFGGNKVRRSLRPSPPQIQRKADAVDVFLQRHRRPGSEYQSTIDRAPTMETAEGGVRKLTWTPTRAADEMRVGLRRRAYRDQCVCALHNMREATGGLRRRGPSEEELESWAWPRNRGPRMKCGWGCGRRVWPGAICARHFTVCPKRPAASEHWDLRGRCL